MTRRVYMPFFLRDGSTWSCDFFEENLFTRIGRQRNFGSADKVRELIARTPTRLNLEDRQALDYGISTGRGAVWLHLTHDQYRALQD